MPFWGDTMHSFSKVSCKPQKTRSMPMWFPPTKMLTWVVFWLSPASRFPLWLLPVAACITWVHLLVTLPRSLDTFPLRHHLTKMQPTPSHLCPHLQVNTPTQEHHPLSIALSPISKHQPNTITRTCMLSPGEGGAEGENRTDSITVLPGNSRLTSFATSAEWKWWCRGSLTFSSS